MAERPMEHFTVDGVNIFEVTDAKARQDVSDLKEDLSSKAEIDGYYEDMTVGDAEQLVSTRFTEDQTPYLFRTTGGSADVGNREYVDGIVGGTVAWNQLVKSADFSNIYAWRPEGGDVSADGGVLTYTISSAGADYFTNHVAQFGFSIPANHVVYIHSETYAPYNNGFYMSLRTNAVGQGGIGITNVTPTPNTWSSFSKVTKLVSNLTDIAFYWSMNTRYAVGDSVKLRRPQIIDLTQMFGSTIADYIYSLEQATAGAGVAWFKRLFQKDYYEYNAGELLSVSGLASHDTVGFNQWDEEWEVGGIDSSTGDNISGSTGIRSKNYISVFPDVTYYNYVGSSTGDNLQTRFYDADKNYIGYVQKNGNPVLKNSTFVIPSNAHYMRFQMQAAYGATYKNDICINLSWDGEKDGTYEPYVEHTYPLDSDVVLRGKFKLDSSNNLYADGDEYTPDGAVNRRYGIADLGTLNWSYDSVYTYFGATLSTIKAGTLNLICAKYSTGTANGQSNIGDKAITTGTNSTALVVRDTAYTDAASFKTAMSGVYLAYELATPTTEEADPYQQTQICDDFGTEEFVSTSPVPVGHNTRYAPNLRAKLEMSPDSPDGDGVYVVQQSNGENTYVSLGSTTVIQGILARLTALEGNTNEG